MGETLASVFLKINITSFFEVSLREQGDSLVIELLALTHLRKFRFLTCTFSAYAVHFLSRLFAPPSPPPKQFFYFFILGSPQSIFFGSVLAPGLCWVPVSVEFILYAFATLVVTKRKKKKKVFVV